MPDTAGQPFASIALPRAATSRAVGAVELTFELRGDWALGVRVHDSASIPRLRTGSVTLDIAHAAILTLEHEDCGVLLVYKHRVGGWARGQPPNADGTRLFVDSMMGLF